MSNTNSHEKKSSLITLEDIVVKFQNYVAVDGFSYSLDNPGIHFLVGPNGAGKTTILDVICGKVHPIAGHVYYEGKNITGLSPEEINSLGISRKFQAPSIFKSLTVKANLKLALFGSVTPSFSFSLFSSKISDDEEDRIDETLETIGLSEYKKHYAANLSHGKKQWLELGMVLIQRPKLILIDEPVAGMSLAEKDYTLSLLQKIGEKCCIIIVEHDMNFVKRCAHDVVVMHSGKTLASGSYDYISNSQEVINVYLGRH